MGMGQLVQFVAATTAIFGAMVGLLLRSMSAQRAELSTKIDGLRGEMNGKFDGFRNEMNGKFDGFRNEMTGKIDGLRNEMNARLEPPVRQVDRLDMDFRELIKGIANGGFPNSR